MTDLRAISIDDAIRDVEDTQRQRYERPSPYRVPILAPPAGLLDYACPWGPVECGLEFESRAELNGHLIKAHL